VFTEYFVSFTVFYLVKFLKFFWKYYILAIVFYISNFDKFKSFDVSFFILFESLSVFRFSCS